MDQLFVIKIGGNIIDDEAKLASFLQSFASINAYKILVHGGGKIATAIGNKLGIQSNYIAGRRITDNGAIDLATMVYGGLINKKIVAQLQANSCNAIGLTGADGNLIPAVKRPVREIDYGWVGDVKTKDINMPIIKLLLESNLVPVLAPLTHDGQGHILNTNADTIASSIASALSGLYNVRLIYCFEKKGVLENVTDDNTIISNITRKKYEILKEEKKISEGIIPKIDTAFAAIETGVKQVLIGDAADILQNITEQPVGTLIQ